MNDPDYTPEEHAIGRDLTLREAGLRMPSKSLFWNIFLPVDTPNPAAPAGAPSPAVRRLILHHWDKAASLATGFQKQIRPVRDWIADSGAATIPEKHQLLRSINPHIRPVSAARIIGCDKARLSRPATK